MRRNTDVSTLAVRILAVNVKKLSKMFKFSVVKPTHSLGLLALQLVVWLWAITVHRPYPCYQPGSGRRNWGNNAAKITTLDQGKEVARRRTISSPWSSYLGRNAVCLVRGSMSLFSIDRVAVTLPLLLLYTALNTE